MINHAEETDGNNECTVLWVDHLFDIEDYIQDWIVYEDDLYNLQLVVNGKRSGIHLSPEFNMINTQIGIGVGDNELVLHAWIHEQLG